MNSWKKEFHKEFGIATFTWNGSHETGLELANKSRNKVKKFISTEIIEKLIADIPDETEGNLYDANGFVKQQLRDKWL